MVHRTEMTTVNADDAAEDIVNAVLKSGFTRIPLWRDKPENIVGILHAKGAGDTVQLVKGLDVLGSPIPLFGKQRLRIIAACKS